MALQRSLALQPDNPEAQVALARVNEQSDQQVRRSRELRTLLDQALADYAQGNLELARAGFTAILDQNPDDQEVRALLQNTETTLAPCGRRPARP